MGPASAAAVQRRGAAAFGSCDRPLSQAWLSRRWRVAAGLASGGRAV